MKLRGTRNIEHKQKTTELKHKINLNLEWT